MFSPHERDTIHLKAVEQALKQAGFARIEPEPLLPTPLGPWPVWAQPGEMLGEHCFEFALGITAWDEWFLKINKISLA